MRSKLNRMMSRKAPIVSRVPLKSRREMKIVDLTKPLKPAPRADKWLVVMVEPRCEDKAITSLREAGHIAWHPQMTLWRTNARMRIKEKVNRPLFPRYIFVAKGDRATKSVMACDHITFLVGNVPKREEDTDCAMMVELSSRQDYGEFDQSVPVSHLAKGDVAAIDDGGPFQGLSGIVARSDVERSEILLELLGSERKIVVETERLRKVA